MESTKIRRFQNLLQPEGVRNLKCQNQNVTKPESVRIFLSWEVPKTWKYPNLKVPKLESVRISWNWIMSKPGRIRFSITESVRNLKMAWSVFVLVYSRRPPRVRPKIPFSILAKLHCIAITYIFKTRLVLTLSGFATPQSQVLTLTVIF